MNRFLPFALWCLGAGALQAQNALQRAGNHIGYEAEVQVSASDGQTPLWLTANKHGVSSVDGSNGHVRASLFRHASPDSLHKWRIGYGIDAFAAYNYTSKARLQQLYADVEWRLVRLSIGAKERPMQLKHSLLSSGSQTLGTNATPIPEVRLELPEYWSITGHSNWAAIKGHIGYGMLTDGRFQQSYVQGSGFHYARHALYHSKAGYLRLGNEKRFPLTLEGGLEMACQFGGTAYNVTTAQDGLLSQPVKMGHGLKDFVDATFGTGGDSTDGDAYANATGNTVGSWLLRLNYRGNGWGIAAYMDHYFEDHSQMFMQYGWKDGLYGVELHLPQNPVATTLVYEHIGTLDQSGPIYHDRTDAIPDQVSGRDDYYNHILYPGWEHWGQAIGNPLFITPLYRADGTLSFDDNRFTAHHVGVSGQPTGEWAYRVLYTYERSHGSYAKPLASKRSTHSALAEVTFTPQRIGHLDTRGWSLKAALGLDHGQLLGNHTGFQLTLSKRGWLVK